MSAANRALVQPLRWVGGKRQLSNGEDDAGGCLITVNFADGFAQEIDLLALVNKQMHRFLSKVGAVSPNGCMEWKAGRGPDGYGKFQLTLPFVVGNGRRSNRQLHMRASRVAFLIHHQRMPIGVVRHSCDNPPCVSPLHLLEGTQKDNRADCVRRGREPRGSRKATAVLTEAIVLYAREAHARGEPYRAIAARLGVKLGTLRRAADGKYSWRHV